MKTILTVITLLIFSSLNAQNQSFTIKNVGSKYSKKFLSKSISNAEWCGFYFQNEAHQIKFDDGSIVEFTSAQELGTIDSECVSEEFIDDRVYSLHKSGRVLIQAKKEEISKFKVQSVKK